MRIALARSLTVLPMLAVALAACEQPVTTLKNEGRPLPNAVAPRASVANGLPLGLAGNIAVDSFTVCSVGADGTYSWSQPGWAPFTTYNGIPEPGDPGSSGTVTVLNGGASAPQAWASGNCTVVYAYPLVGHTGGHPVVTASWQPQAGIRLDSIIKDSVKAQDLSTHTGPLETILPASTGSSTVAGVVNNDYGSIAFFYFTKLPSLQLVKTADAASVPAGQQIGFSMVVTNNGPGVANAVTLTDVLPTGSGLSWSVASPATGCSIASGALTCSLDPLAAGASASVHIVSPTTTASCSAYSNTATAVADQQPGVQSTAQTTVVCPPNLSLSKVADAQTVSAGSPIGFSLVVSNAGPGTASAVTLTDPLPTGTGIVWSVAGGTGASYCQIAGGVLSCNFGDVAAGVTYDVHVTSPTTAQSCATYTNTATLQATNSPLAPASASTSVQCPGLAVTKTADAPSVTAGSPIGFSMTVTSTGPGTATGVTLTDALPAGLTWAVASSSPTCTIANGTTLTCNFGDLAASATASVHVTAPTSAAVCGIYNNTATAQSSNGGAATSPQASTEVICPPSLSITKKADAASVKAGNPIGFTITLSSNGPGTATGVTLTDALPTGTGISWSMSPGVSGCSISSGTLTCSFGSMAAGTTQTVHLTSPTMNGSCGTYNNTASFTAGNAPGGQASASTSVTGCLTVCTATMGGWGQGANGHNIGWMRDTYFSSVYTTASGVLVGTSTRYIQLKTAGAVEAYLPATGGIGVLDKSYVNPTSTPALTFGGQVTALRLNIDFSNAQVNGWKPGLASALVASGPLAGKTVAQVLTIAQSVLAGGALPTGMTLGDLNKLISAINGMNSPDGCGYGDGTVRAP